jgi:hypothetical protein
MNPNPYKLLCGKDSTSMISTKILVLDVDGVINPSILLTRAIRNPFISGILAIPLVRQLAMGTIETGESLLGIKYNTQVHLVKDESQKAKYTGIITDRSARGLRNALGQNQYILDRMTFIQVRESALGNVGKLKYGPGLWKSNKLKPHESVFYRLAEFAESKGVSPNQVLVMDDDFNFRLVAKFRFGFRVYPDDTIDGKEINPLPHMQRMMAPA